MLLQIYIAFKLEPVAEQSVSELEAYEKVMELSEYNPEVANFIENQNDNLIRKNEVISALIDLLKYFGGFIAFGSFVFLLLLFRREKKKH
jgi:hypothetical protein